MTGSPTNASLESTKIRSQDDVLAVVHVMIFHRLIKGDVSASG